MLFLRLFLILGCFWAALGRSWAALGLLLAALGPLLAALGPLLGCSRDAFVAKNEFLKIIEKPKEKQLFVLVLASLGMLLAALEVL